MSEPTARPSAEEIAEEARRLRRLRTLVDLTAATLYQSDITPSEGVELIVSCRQAAVALFPGREETFDLLYRPRLIRILRERFGDAAPS
ncbi:MAG TPA: hypothetical protein VJV23_12970 [Candidatus Polarisedimenticolia bacterium]|nr:hypothetical protein [Candidatus Polarisedimenticolia bacterium]